MNKERAEKFSCTSFEDKWSLSSKVQCHKTTKTTKNAYYQKLFLKVLKSEKHC